MGLIAVVPFILGIAAFADFWAESSGDSGTLPTMHKYAQTAALYFILTVLVLIFAEVSQ